MNRQHSHRTGRRSLTTTLTTAVATTTALLTGGVAGAPGASAAEDPGRLSLTGPTQVTVGMPAVLTATGHVPTDAFFARYVYLYEIPASVTGSCPAERTGALQLSYESTGKQSLAFVQVQGDFSIPLVYKATDPGAYLLCAYLTDMSVVDAYAQHAATAQAAAAPPGPTPAPQPGPTPSPQPPGTQPPAAQPASAPVSLQRPRLVQRGRVLVCQRGSWSGAAAYGYRWKVRGALKPGATRPRLRVTRAVRGARVQCVVTARNDAGRRTVLSRPRRAR